MENIISKKFYDDNGVLDYELLYDAKTHLVQHITYNKDGDEVLVKNYKHNQLLSVEEYVTNNEGRVIYENHYDENNRLIFYYEFVYDKNGDCIDERYFEIE